jgi:uridine phosphorylase
LQKEAAVEKPALSPAILKGEEKAWTPSIATDEQAVGILKVKVSDVNPRCLVAGDPARIKYLATLLDSSKTVADNREYYTVSGVYKGVPVTLSSHGVGGGGASMCFHELMDAGAKVIIRAGTCGSFQPHLREGSVIVVSGAVRRDGVTDLLVPQSYPAVAHHHCVQALDEAAKAFDPTLKYDVGFCVTEGVFYDGPLGNMNEFWQKCGVKCVEMEASVLFTMCALRGVKGGAIMNVDNYIFERLGADSAGYKPHRQVVKEGTERMCKIALEALIKIAISDAQSNK